MSQQWKWDGIRKDYYYWSDLERCYVYQSRARVYQAEVQSGPNSYSEPTSVSQQEPGSSNTFIDSTINERGNRFHDSSITQMLSAIKASQYNNPQLESAGYGIPAHTAYSGSNITPSSPSGTNPSQGYYAFSTSTPYGGVGDGDYTGFSAQLKYIQGTPGDTETLNPSYKVRRPGSDFFKRGKVFKMLWHEPAGNVGPNTTDITSCDRYPEENIYSKIRWFVVINESQNCCQCLPIHTYGYQGVSKPEVIKSEHAIIYTGDTPPKPMKREEPAEDERGMLEPIKVVPRRKTEKLDDKSRVNLKNVYTIQHNVKVSEFGGVADEHQYLLWYQFDEVWRRSYQEADQEEGGEEEIEAQQNESGKKKKSKKEKYRKRY